MCNDFTGYNGTCIGFNGPCGSLLVIGHLLLVTCYTKIHILMEYVPKHTTYNIFLMVKSINNFLIIFCDGSIVVFFSL